MQQNSTSSNNTSSRNFISMQNKYDRVILLVDMDCFYCQVEEKLDATLKGKPMAVVQYNAWRGGGIIAVNYAARAKGVTRHMRGDEAKEQCPEIQLVKVPSVREKADLSKYREAGKEVANVLQRFTPLLERASVDEAYLDITETVNKRLQSMNTGSFVLKPEELLNTFAMGYTHIGEYITKITKRFSNPNDMDDFMGFCGTEDEAAVRKSDIRLLIGASIAGEIRLAVKTDTGYECSAGIAHNKILAKLGCGLNKPNKQTILPLIEIPKLFDTLPVGKITGLGGKFGEEVCERCNIRFLGQLLKFTEAELQRKFDEKNGSWLYNICRGIELEAVTPRFYSKSIGCCKKFPGRNSITGLNTLRHWLNELATEICDRLDKDMIENNRKAKQMVVNFIQEISGEEISSSRSAPLNGYDIEILSKNSLEIIKANTKCFFRAGSDAALNHPIRFLGISVGKFETITNAQNKLQEMFANQLAKKHQSDEKKKTEENFNDADENREVLEMPLPAKQTSESVKMKSFFINYLQTKKSAVKKDSANSEKELDIKKKVHSTETNMAQQYEQPEARSFFLNALKQQKEKMAAANNKELQTRRLENIMPEHLEEEEIHTNEDEISKSENELVSIEKQTSKTTEIPVECTKNVSFFHTILNRSKKNAENISETKANNSFACEIQGKKRKFVDIAECAEVMQEEQTAAIEAAELNYQSSYAEFAVPEFRGDLLQYINCEICDAKVPNDERSIQNHQDHHFAQQLSQQQRTEFRAQIKAQINASSKTSPNTGTNKKSKKSVSTAKPPNRSSSNITKFLKATVSDSTALQLLEPTTESEICKVCNQAVPKNSMPEHKDFHLAKELQRKLNQLQVETVVIAKKPTKQRTAAAGVADVSSKSIKEFLSQTNC